MKTLEHRFVENIPDQLDEGVLYISIPFETVIHKCCCGCEKEVVTPLSPAAWSIIFDGETVSLRPSIGNWSFECRSHYWIMKDKVRWAEGFSEEQMDRVKHRDLRDSQKHYDQKDANEEVEMPKGWFRRLLDLFKMS